MTKNQLLKGLLATINIHGIKEPEEINSTFCEMFRLSLDSRIYTESEKKTINAAYLGLCIGHKIGFQDGINHIFEYIPE